MLQTVSNVLILAPHTDDGELGCGSSIAWLMERGKKVYYLALSSCEGSVPGGLPDDVLVSEVREATKVLGIAPEGLKLGGFNVRSFDRQRQEILDLFIVLERQLKPDLVFMPSLGDLHQDHATVAAEGMRAFKRTSILAYEMPWNNMSFHTQCFLPLEDRHVDLKIKALECYRSNNRG
jgi:N-acetylglucosamine malate deacetylase 1